VSELLEENERMAWIVEMVISVLPVIEQVKKGLPLTRKNRKFEEGISKVTLRSL
jgi:hypothetical protein